MSFSQGDYTYSLVLESKSLSNVTLSYGQSYTYTLSPIPVSEANDTDTYICLYVFDHEEGHGWFKAGVAATGHCRSVYYNYNGGTGLTVTCYSEGESSSIGVSFSYYNNGGVMAVATDKTKTTYANIPSSVTNGDTTYSITSLKECFYKCTSMTTFPTVPNTVINYYNCFAKCSSLSGTFNIPNNQSVENTASMFYSTSGDIFLVTNYAEGTSNHTSLKNIWQPVASTYSNVFFEADGNPVHTADVVLSRVDSTSGEDDPEGESVKINCTVRWSTSRLPSGWTQSQSVTLVLDSETSLDNPTWTTSGNSMTGTISNYLLGDSIQHIVSMVATQTIKDGSNVTKLTRTASDVETLSAVFAIFDFYPGGRGLALGAVADSEGLNVSIESIFNKPMKINNESGLFIDTAAQTSTDGTINTSLSTLGWGSLISNSYLSLKQSFANLFSFIATTGSDTSTDSAGVVTSWTWRKWPDGTFDMWATETGNFSQTGVIDDNANWLTYIAYFNFPNSCKPIDANYMVFTNWGDLNYSQQIAIPCQLSTLSTSGFNIHATKYTTSSTSNRYTMNNVRINIYIHGLWK